MAIAIRSTQRRPGLEAVRAYPVAAGLAGGGMLVAGALLPWVTFYQGLVALRGTQGRDGMALLGLGIAAIVAALLHAAHPGAASRSMLAAIGVGASAFGAWVLAQLLGSLQQAQSDPLALSALGPGAFVAAAGAVVVLSSLLAWPRHVAPAAGSAPASVVSAAAAHSSQVSALVAPAAALVAGAGVVHLAVAGPHLAEWWGYTLFFAVAGIAQLAGALLLWVRPSRRLGVSVIAANLGLAAMWLLTRTAGIPVGPASAGDPEAVGFADVTATGLELGAVLLILVLLVRGIAASHRSLPRVVGAVACAVVLVLSVAAAMSGASAG